MCRIGADVGQLSTTPTAITTRAATVATAGTRANPTMVIAPNSTARIAPVPIRVHPPRAAVRPAATPPATVSAPDAPGPPDGVAALAAGQMSANEPWSWGLARMGALIEPPWWTTGAPAGPVGP